MRKVNDFLIIVAITGVWALLTALIVRGVAALGWTEEVPFVENFLGLWTGIATAILAFALWNNRRR